MVLIVVFSLRLYVDNNNLKTTNLPAGDVTHIFKIKDDPQFKFYKTKARAIDLTLGKHVLIVGTSKASSNLSTFSVGDTLEAQGYFSELGVYESYLKNEHVVGVFTVTSVNNIAQSSNYLENMSSYFRQRITNGCARLSFESQGICEGILIGEKSNISKETYDKYKSAQLTHLLVASGANIVFILAFLAPILIRLNLRTKFSLMCAIAIFYCIITRFEPSILRAAVMVCVPSVGRIRGYRLNKYKIYFFSIAVCLMIDPSLMYRVGFWLSSAATGGLYFLTPKIKHYIESELVASTLGATIAVQPVLWISFGFSWPFKWPISVLAIAIAEPLSTVGFVFTFVTSYLDPSNMVSKLMSLLMNWGCQMLNICAGIGDSKYSSYFGLILTVLLFIAYNRKRAKFRYQNNKERQSYLHYRR
jgi:ComEC/Rec2-related protein